MLKKMFLLLSVFVLLFGVNFSKAATFNVTLTGTDVIDPIHAFTIWLEVSGDFSINGVVLGDAIPTKLATFGWLADQPTVVSGNPAIFKYGASDWDYTWDLVPNPLGDGTLFSLDYDGSVLNLNRVEFSDITGLNNLYPSQVTLESFTQTGLSFTAVPIPSTLFLLGGGLVGLFGIRRRVRKG